MSERLVARGQRYRESERGFYWLWSAVCERMGQDMSNDEIGDTFSCGKDTVRNARLALQAYHDLRSDPRYREKARTLRRMLEKSMWEIAGARYERHHDVEQLFKDLWFNVELSARDLKETLAEKYDGPELPRLLAKWQRGIPELRGKMWSEIDRMGKQADDELKDKAHGLDRSLSQTEKKLEDFIHELHEHQEPF